MGLICLWVFSNALVDYSALFGRRMGISSFVVGIVIVGLGTSIPELLVSSLAAAQDNIDLAVGNIVGSNSANLSLAIGLAALAVSRGYSSDHQAPSGWLRRFLHTFVASPSLNLPKVGLRRLIVMSTLSVGVFAIFVQGDYAWYEGASLLALLVPVGFFTQKIMRQTHTESPAESDSEPGSQSLKESEPLEPELSLKKIWFWILTGLAGTIAGAQLLIVGTEDLAEELNLGTGFLGLTLVAIGTSAPEIIVGIRAARRGETAILAGNLLGSNISNSLLVGGVVGLIAGHETVMSSNITAVAVPVMFGLAVLGGIFMSVGRNVYKWEAVVLIVIWLALLPFVVDDAVSGLSFSQFPS